MRSFTALLQLATWRPVLLLSHLGILTTWGLMAQSVVVPNASQSIRGTNGLNSITRNAGAPRTYMFGIPASQLAAIPTGAVINGVSFRAWIDAQNPSTWPPSNTTWTDYTVTVGRAIPLASWTGNFLSNFSGTPVQVRTGSMVITAGIYANNLSLPYPQPNTWGDYFWDFKNPYTYTGGDLAILMTHPGSQGFSALFLDTVNSGLATGVAFAAASYQATSGGTSIVFCVARIHYGYGNSCPGSNGSTANLVLSNGTTGGGRVAFSLANSLAGAPAGYVMGASKQRYQLHSACWLETLPIVALPVTLDALGRNLLSLTAPSGVIGTVELQGFVIDAVAPFGYTTTNATTLTMK